MVARSLLLAGCGAGLAAAPGCSEARRQPQPQAAAAPVAKPETSTGTQAEAAGPPRFTYQAAQAWHPSNAPDRSIAPPDPAQETWRVFVNQHQPMQKKTPHWRPLPATQTVTVEMPADSHLRCVISPLSVTPETNDFGTQLKAWYMRRDLVCSGDGFRTWSVYPHQVRLQPDGKRESLQARALLRERAKDGAIHKVIVLVRDQPEQREATTGPPQLRPELAVDD